MVKHTRPFAGKYTRYIMAWLFLGLLGPLVLWPGDVLLTTISIVLALLFTVGYDLIVREIVKRKAKSIAKENAELVLDALRYGRDQKGFLVVTKTFLIFVPLLSNIKTVIDTNKIVRHEFDGQILELTVKFPNKHRMFQFYVSSPVKVEALLLKKSGKSLPYKYDKMKKNNSL
ncbi:hypothetical protein [Salipaludibacillus sp. CF4.18]|uniref:hypothetical protein n=1 Tax=Salipaludibacillus sp. CF4.18 TaxID=3373081 RepID=UPI003EE4FEB9